MTVPPFTTTSSFCYGGECVAVAALPDGSIIVRDDKQPDGPTLCFRPDEWDAFIAGAKNSEFDREILQQAMITQGTTNPT